ncbi:prostaglandin reductase 1-like [Contarinia nasturtii]|uniref:prostaglandin reductase 1-like n=1 Tax=Contarinia nasturtii TaxID=265458 RepID=UPI0012D41B30|nr:prostaglandin reductase 1-like [Contarinia nasturtii]
MKSYRSVFFANSFLLIKNIFQQQQSSYTTNKMVNAKKFIFAKRFDGLPKVTDFRLEEEVLEELKDGEVLLEAIYLSVDPYMRPYSEKYPTGITMIGSQIAKVIESKNSAYPKDALVCGYLGWRTHTIFNPNEVSGDDAIKTYILPSFGGLPPSLGLGQLGMPGNTAYFGFLDICKPKEGEVVVVSGAAGAVGNLVGQIGKIKGCKVIGIAGSDDKCTWLTSELGFDHAINYKTESVAEVLKKYAPDGVDCYFDNVGGAISSIVINQMRDFGRISVCGSISSYNTPVAEWPKVPILQPTFVFKQLKMEGFIVSRFCSKWFEAIQCMKKWTDEGKLKYRETVTNGFENMPQALIDMLQGQNTGKAIVKV